MDRKKLLITGGSGFVGSYLANHYSKTHTVIAPGHSVLDLTNAQSVDRFFASTEVDVVVHCALFGRDKINAVDPQVTVQNLEMFTNLWRNRHKFGKLINCGTGNEFDTSLNIDSAPETELYNHLPMASYGYAKNMIARICNQTEQFYNLRFFGVFHHTESSKRFFKLLMAASESAPLRIYQDHEFDFVNLEDIIPMIDVIVAGEAQHNDINIVYPTKRLLSEHAYMFADALNIPSTHIAVGGRSTNNFTGNGSRYASYGFELKGLKPAFLQYRP